MLINTNIRQIYVITAIILTAALLTPSFVKLSHTFQDHKHEICLSPTSNHYHEFDVECEFYKFKITSEFVFVFTQVSFVHDYILSEQISSKYTFQSNYQNLQILLRGPPYLV